MDHDISVYSSGGVESVMDDKMNASSVKVYVNNVLIQEQNGWEDQFDFKL